MKKQQKTILFIILLLIIGIAGYYYGKSTQREINVVSQATFDVENIVITAADINYLCYSRAPTSFIKSVSFICNARIRFVDVNGIGTLICKCESYDGVVKQPSSF